jgi:hypothetical protein
MKKLVLILAALVAVVAFAMPLAADDQFEVSGEFTFGMITAFDSEKDAGAFDNAYIDMFFYPDEYNEVFFEMAWAKAWEFTYVDGNISAIYFALRTDVGAFLGLPIGVVNHAGIDSLYTNKYEVTGHAYERVPIRSNIDPVPWQVRLDGGSWQFNFALGWGQTDPAQGEVKGENNDLGFYLFLPNIADIVEIEAFYLAQDNPDWKGRLGFSAKADGLAGGLLGVAGGFVYDLRDDAVLNADPTAPLDKWAYGVGVGFDVAGAAIGASIWGNEAGGTTNALNLLGIDLDYAFANGFGAIAAAAFDFKEGAPDTFIGLDIGVYVKPGGAKWQIGYLYRPEGSGYAYSWTPAAFYAAPVTAAPEGGLYVLADIDF